MNNEHQQDNRQVQHKQIKCNFSQAILERLALNDRDFNGQSLDYEPNLEFDDTELCDVVDNDELEQIVQLQKQLATRVNITAQYQNDNEYDNVSAQRHRLENDDANEHDDEDRDDDATLGSRSSNSESTNDLAEFATRAAIASSELSDSQDFIVSSASGQQSPYLDVHNELLEENFEEAFRSSLFVEQFGNNSANDTGGPRCSAQVNNSNVCFSKNAANYNGYATRNKYHHSHHLKHSNKLQFDGQVSSSSLVATSQDFSEIAQYSCVEVAGDDLFGRRIVTIYACRLPPTSKVKQQTLLDYIMFTLDKYVENDYCVVYFHHGLNSTNKPKLNFLYHAYKAFDRKYKKNLKALFLVHPTNFIRIVWQLFKPAIR